MTKEDHSYCDCPSCRGRRRLLWSTPQAIACSCTIALAQGLLLALVLWPTHSNLPQRLGLPDLGSSVVLCAASIGAAAFLAVPLARLLMRMTPVTVPMDGLSQTVSLFLITLNVAIGFCGFLLPLFFAGFPVISVAADALHAVFRSPLTGRGIRSLALLVSPVAYLVSAWWLCVTSHFSFLGGVERPTEPYCLFLRRFNSFADFSLFAGLLRARARGLRLLALMPTSEMPMAKSKGGNWNPLTIGYAGLSLTWPRRSIPIFIQATDESWQATVKALVRGAAYIVMDESEQSPSIRHEFDILRSESRAASTLLVAHCAHRFAEASPAGEYLPQDIRRFRYRTSRIRGLAATIPGLVLCSAAVWSGLALLASGPFAAAPGVWLLFVGMCGCTLVSFRPSMSMGSEREFRRVLVSVSRPQIAALARGVSATVLGFAALLLALLLGAVVLWHIPWLPHGDLLLMLLIGAFMLRRQLKRSIALGAGMLKACTRTGHQWYCENDACHRCERCQEMAPHRYLTYEGEREVAGSRRTHADGSASFQTERYIYRKCADCGHCP